MKKKFDVYGMGNALVDVQFQVGEQALHDLELDKGGMRLVDTAQQNVLLDYCRHLSAHRASGGSAANSMIALAQLGGRAAYGCLVGDDELGRFYFDEMQSLGVHLHTPPVSGQPTGTCIILITPDAERTMNTALGASGVLSVEHVTEDALKQATWLYLEGYLFSTPSGQAAARRALELARKHQVKVSLTFSDRFIVETFGDALRAAVAECDLVFANQQEAGAYVGQERAEDIFPYFQEVAPNVVMTRGDQGAWGRFGGTTFQVEAVPVQRPRRNRRGRHVRRRLFVRHHPRLHGRRRRPPGLPAVQQSRLPVGSAPARRCHSPATRQLTGQRLTQIRAADARDT